MKSKINNIDDSLLAKYLDGSTTDRENAEVELWLAESSENRQVFDHFQKIWVKSRGATFQTDINFDKKAAFQSVLKHIEKASNNERLQIDQSGKPIKFNTFFARVAAVFIIGIAIYFVYHNYNPSHPDVLLTDTNEGVPFVVSEDPFITLPDNSLINLNEGGEIKYAKDFLENRLLSITGEAFFEVKKHNKKAFIVETNDIEVKVLGTSFYMIAYDNDSLIEVGVKTGEVRMSQTTHQTSVLLKENETVTYNKETKSFSRPEAFNPNKLFWLTGVLEFNEQPLDQVFSTLSRVYDTKIIFQESEFENCKFTGRFQHAGLDEIIALLQISFAIEATIGEQVVITGKACEE